MRYTHPSVLLLNHWKLAANSRRFVCNCAFHFRSIRRNSQQRGPTINQTSQLPIRWTFQHTIDVESNERCDVVYSGIGEAVDTVFGSGWDQWLGGSSSQLRSNQLKGQIEGVVMWPVLESMVLQTHLLLESNRKSDVVLGEEATMAQATIFISTWWMQQKYSHSLIS